MLKQQRGSFLWACNGELMFIFDDAMKDECLKKRKCEDQILKNWEVKSKKMLFTFI